MQRISDAVSMINVRNDASHGPYRIADGHEAKKCAKEGEKCSCLGKVHFGAKSGSFLEMHKSNVSIIDTREANPHGFLACDASTFNVLNSTGVKECYCERAAAPASIPKAERCANDAGSGVCRCIGTAFYGRRHDSETNATLTFGQMLEHGFSQALS